MNEYPISIKNKNGFILFGILHHPNTDKLQKKIGINLLNPGLKNRVAPNRLNIKIARTLADAGYYVLRVDPSGIGDSQGELKEDSVVNLWGEIQKGFFVDDTICMNDFFIEYCDLDELILIGACGGAITAILTAEKDKRINFLALIDIPVTIASTKMVSSDHLNIIEADNSYRNTLSNYYFKMIFNPKSWLRILTLKSDIRAIIKILKIKILDFFCKKPPEHVENMTINLPNFNMKFLNAFQKFLSSNNRILFICAEKDTDTQLFEKGFVNSFLKNETKYDGMYEIHKIKDANHIYTLTSSQQSLLSKITVWLNSSLLGK